MRRKDYERIEELVALYLSFVDKNDTHERIAKEGENMAGKIADYHGDLPQSGAYKPETIGKRAETCQKIPITSAERHAHGLIMEMPVLNRLTVTVWPQIKHKVKPGTRNRYRLNDLYLVISLMIGRRFTASDYREEREKACEYLLERDRQKPQHIEEIKEYATAC